MVRTISVTGTVSLFLVCCSATCAIPALAAGKVYSLRQAVDCSMENNGELRALREERGVREAGSTRAGLYPNPVLEVGGATGELTGSRFENNLAVGVSQELLTMGKRGKRLQVAEKETEGFDRQMDDAKRLLNGEVKATFYDLILAEKRVELAERSLALSMQLLDVTRQRLEAGDIPELEMNLARVEAARSEERKLDAERDLYPARMRLMTLMGLSPGEAATFSGSLKGEPFTRSLDELKEVALAKRPDLRALESAEAKGDAEISLARAERVPNVTVALGYQRENTAIEVGGSDVKSRDDLLGLKLSIPIPLFDRNQAAVREAQARKGSAERRYRFARLNAEREVEAAYSRLTAAEKSLAIYAREIIPQLEENLKLVQEAYRLGEVGVLTVIEEQKKFFEVHDGYLSALNNRQRALTMLETAAATDLTGGVQ